MENATDVRTSITFMHIVCAMPFHMVHATMQTIKNMQAL